MTSAAQSLKRVTLELGGKSPTIIFDDCDIEAAAQAAPLAVFDNSGQDCCARSRILVQRSVYDRVLAAMEPVVKGMRVGDPALETTDMGPLISRVQHDRVKSFVPAGAPIAFQGDAPSGKGFWFPPTILAPVTRNDIQYTNEIFGPVAVVIPFDDEAQAIEMANETEYGLAASIFTKDVGRAIRVARGVESGAISVNSHSSVRYWTPFGGFKQSGIGRELGPNAIEHFTETKNVFISTES
jgi:acyl-CoA reductase-like NAD-dependent aldehyde dehydrogenase